MDPVALASVMTSGVLGLAGLIGGALIARADRAHTRSQAADARRQERIQEVYIQVLGAVLECRSWQAKALSARVTQNSTPPPPPLEWLPHRGGVELINEMEAKLVLYSSDEVREAFGTWVNLFGSVMNAWHLDDLLLTSHDDDLDAARRRLESLLRKELQA